MSAMTSQITGVSIFAQPFVQAQIKETWTGLCERNPPVDSRNKRASNAENIFIWWRHHVGHELVCTVSADGLVPDSVIIWMITSLMPNGTLGFS